MPAEVTILCSLLPYTEPWYGNSADERGAVKATRTLKTLKATSYTPTSDRGEDEHNPFIEAGVEEGYE